MATLPPDPTLDEIRLALAPAIAAEAAFDGWGDVARDRAATASGIDPGHARLAFPDGAVGMIDAWYATIDARLAIDFPPDRVAAMKVRDRIRALVLARLRIARPDREAARRALAVLANPVNAAHAARLGWRAADVLWRIAGDRSVDVSWYTRRVTLAAVYASTLLVWLDDRGEDEAATAAFLDRRLAGVMRFERVKAQLRGAPERRFSLTRLAGRLRYPSR